jgi:hypothetical protein
VKIDVSERIELIASFPLISLQEGSKVSLHKTLKLSFELLVIAPFPE